MKRKTPESTFIVSLIFLLTPVLHSCSQVNSISTYSDVTSHSSTASSHIKETTQDPEHKKTRQWDLEHPPSIKEISKAVKDDTAGEQLEGIGTWWLFGPGLGHSILNIGTAVLFPPYALYLLGNAGLALAGEEPIKIVNILPHGPRELVSNSIDSVCSVPGRITSAVAQRPYVEQLNVSPRNKTPDPIREQNPQEYSLITD